MKEYYVNFCVNLDDRDNEGKPKIVKTPEEFIHFNDDDVVNFSISIIENGVEIELKTAKLWNEIAMVTST